MRTVRNIALAAVAAGALALGSAALAQDAKKPQAKPESSHEHRGAHGMNRVHEMRGGCHGESRGAPAGEHDHS
jgi:Spy/CpxP family protein refolding chaperone